MMRRVALWPVRPGPALPYAFPASPAAKKADAEPKRWPSMDLVEALQTRHMHDAWFQCVTGDRGHWPRVAKPILLRPRIVEVLGLSLGTVGVDLDRPDHGTNPWRTREDAELAVQQTVSALDFEAAVYATRGGLRVLWVVDPPIPLALAQSFLDALHREYLPRFGLPVSVDRGVNDWTRGYRLPWCPRADGKAVPWGDDAPPMELSALNYGRTLEWRPAEVELQVEEPRDAVIFDWSNRSPASGTLDERIRQHVASWCDEIARASSRHEVLLRKTRALGGLCVGHGVSPAPYVPALVSAAGDSGDAIRTATDGLAHGAQEPWKIAVPRQTSGRLKRAYARLDA